MPQAAIDTPSADTLAWVPVADRARLAAERLAPRQGPRRGLALLVHGFAGSRHEGGLFDALADRLVASGFVVVRHDWRGLGDSEGEFADTSLDVHAADLRAVLAHARAQDPGLPVVGVGFSLGAALLGMVAPEARLDRLVYLSPASRPAQAMWPRYAPLWSEVSSSRRVRKPGSDVALGMPILASLRDTDLGDDAFQTGCPLLVLHGTSDARVPFEGSEALARRVSSRAGAFRFEPIPGASHSFRPSDAYWHRVADRVASWSEGR